MCFKKLWFYYFSLAVMVVGILTKNIANLEAFLIAGIVLVVYAVDVGRGKFDDSSDL